MSMPEKLCVLLTEGRATTSELQAELEAGSGKRNSMLKATLARLQRKGVIRRSAMMACRERRTTVKPVVVWELVG